MSATEFEQTRWPGLLGAEAGDTVDGLTAVFVVDDSGGIAFNTKYLAEVWEVEVVVEFATDPDVTELQPAVGFIDCGVRRGEKRSS